MSAHANCSPIPCKLPSDLFATYLSYKQSTRTIVTWLIQNGTRKGTPPSSAISIRELWQISENIWAKGVKMPPAMGYIFRDMIEARKRLGGFFKKVAVKETDTSQNTSHEYFTARLTEIYHNLCGITPEEKRHSKVSRQSTDTKVPNCTASNRFETLSQAPKLSQDTRNLPSQEIPTSSKHADDSSNTLSERNAPRLAQDGLGDAIELLQAVEELHKLSLVANLSWKQVSDGSLPIYMAAFVTNASIQAMDALDEKFRMILGASDPKALQTRFETIQTSLMASPGSLNTSETCKICSSSSITITDALQVPWSVVTEFKQPCDPVSCTCPKHQNPHDFFPTRGCNRLDAERVCLATVLDNLGRLIEPSPNYVMTTVVRRGTPLYREIKSCEVKEPELGIKCAFGLRTLLESYESYLRTEDGIPARPNCRIQALRFAGEAIFNVKAVLGSPTMPCRCCRTLAFYLELLHDDLLRFTQEKVFDLYFQSPWVAGSHMLEILGAKFYYGLRLCSYRNYVGAVLHTYNVLTRCYDMPKIQVIEKLCDVFSEVVFLGERPSHNFQSLLIRFIGGRLRFHRKNRHRPSNSYNLELPKRMDSGTFGLRKELNDDRFRYDKISLFHHIKDLNYVLDDELLAQLTRNKTRKRERCMSKADNSSRKGNDHPAVHSEPLHPLQQMQQAVLSEFEGDFPAGKINFFAVYLACVRIVGVISDKSHEEKGRHCICFADRLLSATDEYQGNKRAFRSVPCQELVDICKEAMRMELEDEPLSKFLWDI